MNRVAATPRRRSVAAAPPPRFPGSWDVGMVSEAKVAFQERPREFKDSRG